MPPGLAACRGSESGYRWAWWSTCVFYDSGGEGSSIGAEGAYPWVEVQPNRYRYPAAAPATVRIVIAEYLAAEIASLPVEKVLYARLD